MSESEPQIKIMLPLDGKEVANMVVASSRLLRGLPSAAEDDVAHLASLRRDFRWWNFSLGRLHLHLRWNRR